MTLKALKQGDDSFSDVVLKLSEKKKKPSLMDLAGTWPGTKEDADFIKKTLEKERKQVKAREVHF